MPAESHPLAPGKIVILNGAPRSGKSSIARAIQRCSAEPWMNLGVDAYVLAVTPDALRPGIGLRPGGESPDLEVWIPRLYAALYESVAAHSRLGLNVVVDVGHHDAYSRTLGILPACARRLQGLPVLFVGVRCPLDEILRRRAASESEAGRRYAQAEGGEIPVPILRWQEAVHVPGHYDLEVDTSQATPEACAEQILSAVSREPQAPRVFELLALDAPPAW